MPRALTKTCQDVGLKDIHHCEIHPVPVVDAQGVPTGATEVQFTVYWQEKDSATGENIGGTRRLTMALTATQKTALANFLNNSVLPAIAATDVTV